MKTSYKIGVLAIMLLSGFAIRSHSAETNGTGQQVARASIICRGPGSIRPNYNGKSLMIGKKYTIVAQPHAGFIFTNWTDGYGMVLTNVPRLTFIMKTNSVFMANFIRLMASGHWLDGVTLADIPLHVLAAVNAVAPEKQGSTLAAWIHEVCATHSSALPSVISTVLAAHPELAAPAVTAAASSCSTEIYGVVYAAVATPGVKMTDVIKAACTELPGQSYQIAQAVLDVDPQAGATLLQTISATVPELTGVIGRHWNGSDDVTKGKTLEILRQVYSEEHWPLDQATSTQTLNDYSQP